MTIPVNRFNSPSEEKTELPNNNASNTNSTPYSPGSSRNLNSHEVVYHNNLKELEEFFSPAYYAVMVGVITLSFKNGLFTFALGVCIQGISKGVTYLKESCKKNREMRELYLKCLE